MANTVPPPLPQEFPHIFTGVAFEVIPEVDYADLCYLSEIVKGKSEVKRYRFLVEALRKIQWAKLAGLEAMGVERDIEADVEESGQDVLLQEPVGQVQHAKAMFDFVAHGKAVLDVIAVFLTDYFAIDAHGGDRDFRKPAFRNKVCEVDSVIGGQVASLQSWFQPRSPSLDSLVAVRDEWLHRSSIATALVQPISVVGYLPVPRQGLTAKELADDPITTRDYWSTRQFIQFHFDNLVNFFSVVVGRCVELQATARPAASGSPISVVPVRVTKAGAFRPVIGRRTRMLFGGDPTPRS